MAFKINVESGSCEEFVAATVPSSLALCLKVPGTCTNTRVSGAIQNPDLCRRAAINKVGREYLRLATFMRYTSVFKCLPILRWGKAWDLASEPKTGENLMHKKKRTGDMCCVLRGQVLYTMGTGGAVYWTTGTSVIPNQGNHCHQVTTRDW